MRKFIARALDLPLPDSSRNDALQQYYASQQQLQQQQYAYNPAQSQPYHAYQVGSQPGYYNPQQPPLPARAAYHAPLHQTYPPGPPQSYQVDHGPSNLAAAVPARASPYNGPPPVRPPIAEGQNHGLTLLSDPGDHGCADVVFVHGLTGNAYNTWLHGRTRVHWPSDLLPNDLQDCRLFTFGYDADIVNFFTPASRARLGNHAENLVGTLSRYREHTPSNDRPIIFVCHSLGGLVVQAALDHSRNRYEQHIRQIERSTIAIAFLGTPHHGSDLAKWGTVGTRLANVVRPANKDIVGVLKPESETLARVQNDFHTILRLRREERREIEITCFSEELPMEGVGEIVPEHSAKIPGYSCYTIHANHVNMTKFPNAHDPGYLSVRGELMRWRNMASAETQTPSQPGSFSGPTALGMRDADVRAIFDASNILHPLLANQYSSLKQVITAVLELDRVIGTALSHHRETSSVAGQSSVSQYAQNVLTFRGLSDQLRGMGSVGWQGNQISGYWNSMYEAMEQRLEQIRYLRRALGNDPDDRSVNSIFGNLVMDDFLIDVMAKRM